MSLDVIRAIAREHTENAGARGSMYPFERAAVERMRQTLMAPSHRIGVLDAPRRAGKSTAFRQLASRLRQEGVEVTYCDLTDLRLRGTRIPELVAALSAAAARSVPSVLLLDEVHYAGDEWSRELKFVVDTQDPRTPRIAIADSAVSFVRSALKADLADRYVPVQMHPLSFAEWLELRRVRGLPAPSPDDELAMLRECHEYLWLGGFPEHATRRDELYAVRQSLLQMVVDQAIRDDIGRLLGLRELDALERLFVARLAESGAQLNAAQAAAASGVSGPTARHWLRAMCDTGLLWELPLHVRSAGKFERTQPKLYAVDPSLVGACAIPVFGREDATLDGRAVETVVAQALRVFCERPERQRRLSVHQARTRGGGAEEEIDFIVEEGSSTFAIEVTRRRDTKKLAKLVQTGRRIGATWYGVVSLERSRREETTVDGERVHQLPLSEFLLGLARSDSGWPW